MERAVVSGVTGHLGQELAHQLVSANVEVHGLTRQDLAVVQHGNKAVRLHHIDGRVETLISIFNDVRPDTMFHIAGFYRRDHQSVDIAGLIETNVLFGTQLLEAMSLAGCRRFVIAGSQFQHFDTDGYRPLNLYAATKQAFEDLIAYYADAFDIAAVRLTLCDIYSEHDTRRKLMTDIALAWRDAVPLNIRDEEVWVDLVHVEDVAAAFLQAATLLESNADTNRKLSRYSVSSGRDLTSAELVALFERLGDRKLTVKRGKGWYSPRRMRPWRGAAVPGWAPRVSIEEGVARILKKQR